MPRWPFSFALLENKDDRAPWNAAIIPYLELKQVFDLVPDTHISKAKYDDHHEVSYFTQFVRRKLYLDAKLLDENSRVWKELQEADPGFRKIWHIHHFAVYDSDVKEDGFPEKWKDKKWFANWVHTNVISQLRRLDEETLKRGTDVILHTNSVKKWEAEKKKYEDDLEKQRLARLSKGELALEKKQKKWEEKLAKDVKNLIYNTSKTLIENSKEIRESLDKEKHAKDQKEDWETRRAAHMKHLEPEDTIRSKEISESAEYAYSQSLGWEAKRNEECEKLHKLFREQDELFKELKHYESFLMDP
ncbi:hypothetical protein NCS57_00906200 [Fusarium keratoplasticum]|uniref:Uncharacterized protein n=1 Tax=Fusarium keratoplasticum TaxID=1328300 RepID=A0ACC0QUR8_9HYPO|nr:hypothetical protein NCS57_00906200 [Fusarium keratoplasticum]KAI8666793.1 hypothetical protein NCS57_00906200 [Fusarium keratoplasticum]